MSMEATVILGHATGNSKHRQMGVRALSLYALSADVAARTHTWI